MDVLGVAQTILALGVFPGGVVLALCGVSAARLAGRRSGWSADPRELFALLLLDLAVAQSPIAGSFIPSLPAASGATPNIAVVAVVLAAALTLAAPETARRRRAAAAAVVLAASMALAVAAASLGLPSITGHPGGAMLAARAATAAALLAAAPALTAGSRLSASAEASLLAGLALLGLSLVTPAGLSGGAVALAAASTVGAAVLYAASVLRLRPHLLRAEPLLGAVWGLAGAGAIAAAVIAAVG